MERLISAVTLYVVRSPATPQTWSYRNSSTWPNGLEDPTGKMPIEMNTATMARITKNSRYRHFTSHADRNAPATTA